MSRKRKGVIVDEIRGRRRARWTAAGQRHTVYLGSSDDPAKCNAALSRLYARLADDPYYLPVGRPTDYLVSELVRDYLAAFDGKADLKVVYKRSLIRLASMHGPVAASDFGPLAFGEWLNHGVTEYGWGRAAVEKARRHVLRAWQWATAHERIPESLYRGLQTVPVPKRAKGPAVRHPAREDHVRAALAVMTEPAASLVRVQLATGARPSEILRLKPMDLIKVGTFTAGGLDYAVPAGQWVYVKEVSKTKKPRVLFFGPTAIRVLRPLLKGRAADRCIFRPRDYSNRGGEAYKPGGYRQAVERACIRAGVPVFVPYQIRHSYKQRVLTALGSDHAKAGLGHSSPTMTARYAAGVIDSERAAEAARLPAAV